jgi:hypothetical protein
MKKLLALTALLLLVAGMAYAGPVKKEIIAFTTLTNTSLNVSSDSINIQGWEKPTIFIVYDETDTGTKINTTITIDGSVDGTSWITGIAFSDMAAPTAYTQTSEVLGADSRYIAWLTPDVSVPIIRLNINSTCDVSTNFANVTAYLLGNR